MVLQAFNVSEPIWFDGLTKNEMMQTIRRLWLSKLGLIHEIKFAFGKGTGKPGQWTIGQTKSRADSGLESQRRLNQSKLTSMIQCHLGKDLTPKIGFDKYQFCDQKGSRLSMSNLTKNSSLEVSTWDKKQNL